MMCTIKKIKDCFTAKYNRKIDDLSCRINLSIFCNIPKLLFFLFTAFSHTTANAADDYIKSDTEVYDGNLSWSAAECSALASWIPGMMIESDRLFDLAYSKGSIFISAYSKGEVSAHAMTKYNTDERRHFFGPNLDFKLGIMFTKAASSIEHEIQTHKRKSANTSIDNIALFMFKNRNCGLLK